jgi:putative addiction module component (TIGR02574 family)
MLTPLTTLFEEARKLTPPEREQLAEMLLDSLDPDNDIEGAWAIEADRRWRDHVASGDPTDDALQVVDDARRELRGGV